MSIVSPVYHGKCESGRFIPDDEVRWSRAFCAHEKKRVSITISRERKARSNHQNRYYHGVIIAMISEYTGQPAESVHDAMRIMFLKVKYDNGMESIRSTSSLSTVEMEDYVARIRHWASEFLSLYIPNPNECEVS